MNLSQATASLRQLATEVPPRGGRVRLTFEGPVAHLVLDHPRARHALCVEMMVAIAEHVHTLRGWDGAMVVLRSASGAAFCAGGDLVQVRGSLGTPERGRQMAQAMAVTLDALAALPQVSVAWLEGAAIGGGAELALAADHRVMAPEAWCSFAQARLGVAAGWGGAPRLVRRVGRTQALRWMTTAARVDADVALATGLADHVGDLPGFIAPVLALPPAGVRAAKIQIAALDAWASDAQVDAFAEVWGARAHREALGDP